MSPFAFKSQIITDDIWSGHYFNEIIGSRDGLAALSFMLPLRCAIIPL